MRLDEACARYWDEHGQHLRTKKDVERNGRLLIKGLGAATLLSEITTGDVRAYIANRRTGRLIPDPPNGDPRTLKKYAKRKNVPLANATVGNECILLKAIINMADDWGAAVPSIKWKKLRLIRAEKQRILTYIEQQKLMAHLDDDMKEIVEFAIATALRLGNILKFKWEQIDWQGKRLVFRTKSIKPEGQFHYLPMTPRIKEILLRHVGHHPVFVFTYMCGKNVNVIGRYPRHAGQRYPFSEGGWRTQWYRALKKAGLWDGKGKPDNFRFHDLRHTAATRNYDATGDLYVVMRLLGHARITTTERYAKVAPDKLREGMEATDRKSQIMSHSATEADRTHEKHRV
jgi:integrase